MITPVVAVDCNGADLGPAEVAAGARLAAEGGARALLFGPAEELEIASSMREIEIVDAPPEMCMQHSGPTQSPHAIDTQGGTTWRTSFSEWLQSS